jgi:hypothetical protein
VVTWFLHGSTVHIKKIQISVIFYPYKLYSCQIQGTVDTCCCCCWQNLYCCWKQCSRSPLPSIAMCVYVHLGCLACECEILNMSCPLLNWQVQRKRLLGILWVSGSAILKYILNMFGECALDWSGSWQKQAACSCDCVHELSSSIECGEILGQLRNC